MPIIFKDKMFHLYNESFSYCMLLSDYGDLLHLHWGKRVDGDISMACRERPSFSACEGDDGAYSLDVLPQEYPTYGGQDLRSPACELALPNGDITVQFRYRSHEILPGKPTIPSLPGLRAEGGADATTLIIDLEDKISGVEASLYYTLFEEHSCICRRAVVKSVSSGICLTNAASASVDFHDFDYEYLHLHGSWAREKFIERSKVRKGLQGIDSKRGASGPAENPFIALMRTGATEDFGDVYGFSLVYSGNFRMSVEVEQYDTMRVIVGINPFNFKWRLGPGEEFHTPEVVMVYSDEGLGGMSRTFHELYRTRLPKSEFRDQARPVLVNNWEATYFNFKEEKLLAICEKAASLGIELFVLDDGWFGRRDNDRSSLGDWRADKSKLPEGIAGLAEKVNSRGLQFGLWIEPEMVSPDSDLYRAHPEWAIGVPGKPAHEGRHQLVLDLSNPDVVDYLTDTFTKLLGGANIRYVKWDMNRNITDMYSRALPAERQGELPHRYVLGLYRLMNELTEKFPHILFEGCSGGAGRFDPGMLHYMPQIWGSDNTDAADRILIQYGTSVVYPASSVCAHVTDVPNHQVGRTTLMKLRGHVAMSGAMGYELDLSKITHETEEDIAGQIRAYKRIWSLICLGDQYRLINPFEDRSGAWMFVSKDKKRAVVFYFMRMARPNAGLRRLKLKGLDEGRLYSFGGKMCSGRSLMNFGLDLPSTEQDFESALWEISESAESAQGGNLG
ncbi:MAG: alpha-galactosidase [Clostridiales bacterium]|jgi:alpha-galactosidase|nr:alpha-galactosidase [Clostridiales bacterium]